MVPALQSDRIPCRGTVDQPRQGISASTGEPAEEGLGSLVFRGVEKRLGLVRLRRYGPSSMKTTRSATRRANPSRASRTAWSCRRWPGRPSSAHFLHHLGIEGRRRLVEEHHAWAHAQRAGDGGPLLLAAGQLARDTGRPARAIRTRGGSRSPAPWPRPGRSSSRAIGASVQFSSTVRCGNRFHCWNTMPTRWRTAIEGARVVADLGAVEDDAAPLVSCQAVDAAQQGRLARTGRAADDDALAALDPRA